MNLRLAGAMLGIVAAMGWASASCAWADRRYYGDTYQVAQTPEGAVELEYSFEYALPELVKGSEATVEHQVELETGLADNWDLAMYQVFDAGPAGMNWSALKLESRVRISDPLSWPVNTMLYVEYAHDIDPANAGILEGKVILDRNSGGFNVAANLMVEKRLSVTEHLELGYDLGASYEFSPKLRVGLEYVGRSEKGNFDEGGGTDFVTSHRLAPTVSVGLGKLWWTLAPTFRLGTHQDGGPDAFALRTLMGVEL